MIRGGIVIVDFFHMIGAFIDPRLQFFSVQVFAA